MYTYGTEVRGSCGDGKEVRCHDSRTRPSTARGKIIIIHSRQTVLAVGSSPRFAPLFWLVFPNLFSNKCKAVTVMRVSLLGSEAIPIPSASTGVYPPSGYKRVPAQGCVVFKWDLFFPLPCTVGTAKATRKLVVIAGTPIRTFFERDSGKLHNVHSFSLVRL
jgi:hypothetical protein